MTGLDRAKQAIREQVWNLLDQANDGQPSVRGYIPVFDGEDEAAERLANIPEWTSSRVVKAVPDRAQLPVRGRALTAGKIVYMASPRLAEMPPFYLLDPNELREHSARQAADKSIAAQIGLKVDVDQMLPVDLVVCGSVAVNSLGARVGKGAGYSDLEVALLAEAGLLSDRTTIATTVHDLQIVNGAIPESGHDFRVDIIATPTQIIRCGNPRRPNGLSWDSLSDGKIAEIPVLRDRKNLL